VSFCYVAWECFYIIEFSLTKYSTLAWRDKTLRSQDFGNVGYSVIGKKKRGLTMVGMNYVVEHLLIPLSWILHVSSFLSYRKFLVWPLPQDSGSVILPLAEHFYLHNHILKPICSAILKLYPPSSPSKYIPFNNFTYVFQKCLKCNLHILIFSLALLCLL
jgi:hypothetical protein